MKSSVVVNKSCVNSVKALKKQQNKRKLKFVCIGFLLLLLLLTLILLPIFLAPTKSICQKEEQNKNEKQKEKESEKENETNDAHFQNVNKNADQSHQQNKYTETEQSINVVNNQSNMFSVLTEKQNISEENPLTNLTQSNPSTEERSNVVPESTNPNTQQNLNNQQHPLTPEGELNLSEKEKNTNSLQFENTTQEGEPPQAEQTEQDTLLQGSELQENNSQLETQFEHEETTTQQKNKNKNVKKRNNRSKNSSLLYSRRRIVAKYDAIRSKNSAATKALYTNQLKNTEANNASNNESDEYTKVNLSSSSYENSSSVEFESGKKESGLNKNVQDITFEIEKSSNMGALEENASSSESEEEINDSEKRKRSIQESIEPISFSDVELEELENNNISNLSNNTATVPSKVFIQTSVQTPASEVLNVIESKKHNNILKQVKDINADNLYSTLIIVLKYLYKNKINASNISEKITLSETTKTHLLKHSGMDCNVTQLGLIKKADLDKDIEKIKTCLEKLLTNPNAEIEKEPINITSELIQFGVVTLITSIFSCTYVTPTISDATVGKDVFTEKVFQYIYNYITTG